MRRDHCTLDQAILKIKNDDKARRIWSKQVYGVDPWDSRLYDLVLCVDSLSVTDIVEILANTIRKKQFQESRDSLEKLNNMALHAKAKALIEAVSPSAEVKFSDSKSIEIYSIGSLLKSDSTIREHLTERLKEKLKIDTVDYKEPVVHPKNYINTFYNIEVH